MESGGEGGDSESTMTDTSPKRLAESGSLGVWCSGGEEEEADADVATRAERAPSQFASSEYGCGCIMDHNGAELNPASFGFER